MNGTVQKPRRFGLFGRRRGEHEEDRALSPANTPPAMFPTIGGTGDIPTAVTPGTAMATADVFACVRVLADAAASLPLIPYRRTPAGRVRVDGSLADLLRAPAPATTQANLIGQTVAHLSLYGNAYLGKFRNAEGRVEQLALLHPDRVTPLLRGGQPVYTVSDERGHKSEHGTDDIVHIRALSTDGLVGLSPVRQCRLALGLAQNLTAHASMFFENGARPGGILKIADSHQGHEMMETVSERWAAGHGGIRNAHRIAVVAGDIDFIPVAGAMDDLQFVEQRQLSTAEIARIFRVPPWMVGASSGDSLTYSNTEQQSLAFATYSLRPWLVLIEQALSEDRDLCRGNVYVEFLLDALLRADSATRSEIYTRALHPETGWLTRAEVRQLENLDPEPPDPVVRPTTPGVA